MRLDNEKCFGKKNKVGKGYRKSYWGEILDKLIKDEIWDNIDKVTEIPLWIKWLLSKGQKGAREGPQGSPWGDEIPR